MPDSRSWVYYVVGSWSQWLSLPLCERYSAFSREWLLVYSQVMREGLYGGRLSMLSAALAVFTPQRYCIQCFCFWSFVPPAVEMELVPCLFRPWSAKSDCVSHLKLSVFGPEYCPSPGISCFDVLKLFQFIKVSIIFSWFLIIWFLNSILSH